MSDIFSLLDEASASPISRDEVYVMNYLLALARQDVAGLDHPLHTEYHLPPKEAFDRLLQPSAVVSVAQLLNCESREAFERLRKLIDEWDGVRLPGSSEAVELIEADAWELLLADPALQMAAQIIGSPQEGVLGYLFDPLQIYKDLAAAQPGARLANNDVYKQLRFLATTPDVREHVKTNLDRRDWWGVLEKWVKVPVRKELAGRLTEMTQQDVSQARVLHELFKLVKGRLRSTGQGPDQLRRSLRKTSLAKLLPAETAAFWKQLKDASAESASQVPLEALEDGALKKNKPEINAERALHIAQEFMKQNVQPIEAQVDRVDVFGMIVLRHRFQGIMEELVSNALHYASLDSSTQSPISYFQDIIRFYCNGEYRVALSNLLKVRALSLEQMGLAYTAAIPGPNLTPDATLVAFSPEDNPPPRSFRTPKPNPAAPQPPRTVKPGELLIAGQEAGRNFEILCLQHLTSQQAGELKASLPKRLADLTAGASLSDRLLKTPMAVPAGRQKLNDALQAQIEALTRCLVLSDAKSGLGQELPSLEVFGKTPQPIHPDQTLVLSADLEALEMEIRASYEARKVKVRMVSGL